MDEINWWIYGWMNERMNTENPLYVEGCLLFHNSSGINKLYKIINQKKYWFFFKKNYDKIKVDCQGRIVNI